VQQRQASRIPDNLKVNIVQDIPYAGTDNSRQMLDLVQPKKPNGKRLPVVACIHGGGWRNGSRKSQLGKLAPIVASGDYVGVSIGYRLSGEAKWPSQIHDCKAAIRWIRANADKYGMDANKIAVWGTSAGGHLVAMLGTSGDVEAMDGSIGEHTGVSSRVACVLDFYGPTNFLLMEKHDIPEARMDHDAPDSPESLLIGGPIQENPDKVATANPITYVTSDDPPFLIVHGDKDPLVTFNQSEMLNAALQQAGVETTLVTVEDGGHGKGFGPEVRDLVDRFLKHHLMGIESEWKDHAVPASSR
jgi:acetyl esterase/lipase